MNEIPDFCEEDLSCNICSGSMHNHGKKEKRIISLLGDGTLNRSYFVCDDLNCGGHSFPKDELLDIRRTSFSPGIRRLMAKIGSSEPFDKGRIDIQEYTGVKVDTKDVERVSEKIGNEITSMAGKRKREHIL